MNHISERPSEPGAVRTRKPRGQGASRRGEILEAAKRLFTEEGFAHATMRRIAAEVVRLRETQGNTGATLGRLQAGLRAYVEFGLERADEYRLTFQVRKARTMKDPCAETDIADLSFEVLVTSVQDLMQSGQFRPGDPMVVAEAIWVSMHGLTSAAIDLHDRMHSDLNKLIDTLIVAVLAGFAAREAVGGLV
jgi:AcrR family transcriptional regulator